MENGTGHRVDFVVIFVTAGLEFDLKDCDAVVGIQFAVPIRHFGRGDVCVFQNDAAHFALAELSGRNRIRIGMGFFGLCIVRLGVGLENFTGHSVDFVIIFCVSGFEEATPACFNAISRAFSALRSAADADAAA